eukprot:TRINITY_DN6943_c0_g1_i17.p1 TRINITY_DN6943_c0_g1~~TRINITY_DN6943_c0_g1_i17.p1  ORF type:complete len:455 (+),score=79.00 TRINITY_DN6943_c0_g1_i17:66-1430(+)
MCIRDSINAEYMGDKKREFRNTYTSTHLNQYSSQHEQSFMLIDCHFTFYMKHIGSYSCLVINIDFWIALALLLVVLYQIAVLRRVEGKWLSMKMSILYLIVLQILSNILFVTVQKFPQSYVFESFFKEIVYTFILHYFTMRACSLADNEFVRSKTGIFTCILMTFFTTTLTYSLFQDNPLPCDDHFWVFTRALGVLLTTFFVVIGCFITNQVHAQIIDHNKLAMMDLVQDGMVTADKLQKEIRMLWQLILLYGISSLVCVGNDISIVLSKSREDCTMNLKFLFKEVQQEHQREIGEAAVLGIVKMLGSYMPIIMTLRVFWTPFYKKDLTFAQDVVETQNSFYFRSLVYKPRSREHISRSESNNSEFQFDPSNKSSYAKPSNFSEKDKDSVKSESPSIIIIQQNNFNINIGNVFNNNANAGGSSAPGTGRANDENILNRSGYNKDSVSPRIFKKK